MENIIKQIVNAWDPISLFPGAPKDEYSFEINEILFLVKKTRDVSTLANGIESIFERNFGKDVFMSTYNECLEIAHLILNEVNLLSVSKDKPLL